jgi:hypothetical protein
MWRAAILLAMVGVLLAQRPFREYPGIEYNNFPLASDFPAKTDLRAAYVSFCAYGSVLAVWGGLAGRSDKLDARLSTMGVPDAKR